MVRVRCSDRDWLPPLHADHAVTGCHPLHDDTTQFTGVAGGVHACVAVRVSVSAGHASPPPDAGVTIVRVRCSGRDWLPFVHADHAPVACHPLHPDTTQFTGVAGGVQAWLTVRVSVSAGHASPPPDAGVTIVRVRCSVRDWLPLVHADHALVACHPLHDDTTQFTGGGGGGAEAGWTTIVTGTTTSGNPLARIVRGWL
jgi:hypothetical protein